MTDALLVIDMLRGFLEEGYPLYCGFGVRSIIPSVQRLVEREVARGSLALKQAAPSGEESRALRQILDSGVLSKTG